MTSHTGRRTPPVLSEVIRTVTARLWTTQAHLAELAGVSDATVSRWASDEAQPRFDQVLALATHHPDHRVRDAFRRLMPSAQDDRVTDTELDVNRDGRIDAEDAADLSLKILDDTATLQRIIQAIRMAGDLRGPVRRDLAATLRENAHLIRHDAELMDRLADDIEEQRATLGRVG